MMKIKSLILILLITFSVNALLGQSPVKVRWIGEEAIDTSSDIWRSSRDRNLKRMTRELNIISNEIRNIVSVYFQDIEIDTSSNADLVFHVKYSLLKNKIVDLDIISSPTPDIFKLKKSLLLYNLFPRSTMKPYPNLKAIWIEFTIPNDSFK